ncbi:emp24/gp25L/p24 family protein [Cardiosporidium cionae]|uniref:Emp24/gp25L/p24 family protein n=1 Tax=Cardiosporidium cionae TaxID=476202 RepID=A0ABQ7J9Q8_9APIC|nr:emp24/gp25L/p24 family protein [Cardiosporidium cionae]|eukprot:KAF8820732.1 emp24/gp25L/p24 family protein [Cardiosporidium cionae]
MKALPKRWVLLLYVGILLWASPFSSVRVVQAGWLDWVKNSSMLRCFFCTDDSPYYVRFRNEVDGVSLERHDIKNDEHLQSSNDLSINSNKKTNIVTSIRTPSFRRGPCKGCRCTRCGRPLKSNSAEVSERQTDEGTSVKSTLPKIPKEESTSKGFSYSALSEPFHDVDLSSSPSKAISSLDAEIAGINDPSDQTIRRNQNFIIAAEDFGMEHHPPILRRLQTVDQNVPDDDTFFVDGPNEAVNDYLDDDQFLPAWSLQLGNFEPQNIFTYIIPARSSEEFFEFIEKTPVPLKGGFIAASDESATSFRFTVVDPKGKVLFEKFSVEGLFNVVAKTPGTYSIIIDNTRGSSERSVTIATAVGNVTSDTVEHVSTVEDNVNQLEGKVREISATSQLLSVHQKGHLKSAQKIFRNIYLLNLLELFCFFLVGAFQIYYLENLVSDRRIL